MGWMYREVLIRCLNLLICSTAVTGVTQPNVQVEEVTFSNIILNWTMPNSELYDYVKTEVYNDGVKLGTYETEDTTLSVDGLIPGALHTFLIRAVIGGLESNVKVILQDTVPLPATNLRLDYFRELTIITEYPFSTGLYRYTLNLPGIEALWEGPQRGYCDCYLATIDPNDGQITQKVKSNKKESLTMTRKFIYLLPGREYTVTVRSTTCGYGHIRPLYSPMTNATFLMPPANPPPLTVRDVTDTSAYLAWEDGDIPGFYDDFEVLLVGGTSDQVKVEIPSNRRKRGRKITGLLPCSIYEFEVYMLKAGIRSANSENAEVRTRASTPGHLKVTDYDETSLSLDWEQGAEYESAVCYRVFVDDIFDIIQPLENTSVVLSDLSSGTLYNVEVTTICLAPTRSKRSFENIVSELESDPALISQVTVPSAITQFATSCSSLDGEKSKLELFWDPPATGDWDGFVVHFSPFTFAEGSPSLLPPVSLPKSANKLAVVVPVTGRKFSATLRTARLSVLSKVFFSNVECVNNDGESSLHCRLPSNVTWHIDRIRNDSHLCIAVTRNPIVNISVDVSLNPSETFVTTKHDFCIPDPCGDITNSQLLRFRLLPLCHPVVSCPISSRYLCPRSPGVNDPNKPDATLISPSLFNACCGVKQYNTDIAKCCHENLLRKNEKDYYQCCFTKWYNRKSQKCCRNELGEAIVLPSTSRCSFK